MTKKTYALISGLIFLIVAVVHLSRIIQGWDIVINGWLVRMYVSWAGLIISGILGAYGLRFGLKDRY